MGETAVNGLHLVAEPNVQDLTIMRRINAPRDRVFAAYMDAKAISQWWGPRRYETIVDKLEARSGGSWRFINRQSDGEEYAFHGVFHDVAAPDRITWTFEFEGMPGHVSLETVTFEENAGATDIRIHSVFESVADRDGMIQSGMEGGLAESMERLEELVTGAAAARPA